MSKKKIILIVIALLLLLAGAAAAYYYFYFLPNQESQNGEPAKTAEPGEITEEFSGDYVSGEVPEDWTIVEYQNGAGSTMLTGGVTYTGLTGLEVKSPAGIVVFKLEGVYGVGGLDSCENYYQFSDDSAAYLAQVQATNAEVGEPAPTIADLTTATYQESELFGIRIRRIGTVIYWDVTTGDAYFQSACGIRKRFINFASPTFNGGGMAVDSYQFTVNETSPESELLDLDTILESLAIP